MGIGMAMPRSVEVSHTTEIKLSQLLDIYLRDHTLLRINSDRVSWDVLGKQRGFTATENADKLAIVLTTQAPLAQLDTGFERFKPPPDVALESTSSAGAGGMIQAIGGGDRTTRRRDDTPAFDFYSGWIYTITRALTPR